MIEGLVDSREDPSASQAEPTVCPSGTTGKPAPTRTRQKPDTTRSGAPLHGNPGTYTDGLSIFGPREPFVWREVTTGEQQ